MKESGAVALGGALGALCRYGVAIVFPFLTFPWGTLLVNYIGSFLLGALTSYVGKKKWPNGCVSASEQDFAAD